MKQDRISEKMPGTGLTSSDDEEGFVPSQLNAGASGKMTYATVQQQQQNTLNTLDEPVWVTIVISTLISGLIWNLS